MINLLIIILIIKSKFIKGDKNMQIGKIFIRSLVGIVTAGIVTVLVGVILPVETMVAMYGAIGLYVYLDKDISGNIQE